MAYDFPKDNRIWRIHWVDGVSVNHYDVSNPYINVVLVEHDPSLPARFKLEHGEVKERQVDVGRLPELTMGSLWLNGDRVRSPRYIRESIQVTDRGVKRQAGSKRTVDGKTHYLIPPFSYKLHNRKKFKDSNCCVIEDKGKQFIITNTEIARFFFATSSYTSQLLFTSKMGNALDKLIYIKHSELRASDKLLVLHSHAYDVDIKPISLLSTSNYAQRAANFVLNSIRKNMYNNQTGFIGAYLPFYSPNPFNMKVEGIWLTRDRFLVFRILRSEVIFPDSVTSIEYARLFEQELPDSDDIEHRQRDLPKLEEQELSHSQLQSQSSPRGGLSRQKFEAEELGFKPNIPVVKTTMKSLQRDEPKIKMHDNRSESEQPEMLSTGADSWTTDPIRGASVIQKAEGPHVSYDRVRHTMSQDFEAYFDAVSTIQRNEQQWGVMPSAVTSDHVNIDGRVLSQLPLTKKKWTGSIDERRHLACTQITCQHKHVLFVDIEKKKESEHYSSALIWHRSFQAFNSDMFAPFIQQMIIKTRWPQSIGGGKDLKQWGEFYFITVPHNYADIESYAIAIAERLRRYVFELTNEKQRIIDASQSIESEEPLS